MESDGSAVGVAEDEELGKLEGVGEVLDEGGGEGHGGVEVEAALGAAGAGEIEGEEMQLRVEGGELDHHEGHRVGASHKAMQDDERGSFGRSDAVLEVGEADSVHGDGTTLDKMEQGRGHKDSVQRTMVLAVKHQELCKRFGDGSL